MSKSKNKNKTSNQQTSCPACGQHVIRTIQDMKLHFKSKHNEKLSDGEAFRVGDD